MRINEDEEYKKYLELIRSLKETKRDLKSIASNLSKIDLEELLEVKNDKRSEKELEEEAMRLLSAIEYPEDNDLKIMDIEFLEKNK